MEAEQYADSMQTVWRMHKAESKTGGCAHFINATIIFACKRFLFFVFFAQVKNDSMQIFINEAV